jgi:hypothetical protein
MTNSDVITYYNVNFHMQTIASFREKESAESFASQERCRRSESLERQKSHLTAGEYRGIKTSVDRAINVYEVNVQMSDRLIETY